MTDLTTKCIIISDKLLKCIKGDKMIYREEEKARCVELLCDELPVLRARIKVSQAELARGVGISRQTYSLIETKKQKMTWVTFMAMIAFFSGYPKTRSELVSLGLIDDDN